MRRQKLLKKMTCGMMALAVAFLMMPAMNVHAASKTYTVTFRPGNVGHFEIAANDSEGEKSIQQMAQEVADQLYGNYDRTVTEMGAIKLTVPFGEAVPVAPSYIVPDDGYCVRTWGPADGETVTRNVDYVADYGRLIDGVEYTVKYVDAQSGESIAPFVSAYANIGDKVTVKAPNSITTSNEGTYVLAGDASAELSLSANAEENVITFSYTYSYDEDTVTREIVTIIPGDTEIVTETHTTYINNGNTVADGGVQAGGGAAEAQGNADGGEDQNLTDIEDEEGPLAQGTGEDENASEIVTDIENEAVPLGNMKAEQGGANTMVIVAGVLGVAALAIFIIWLQARRKRSAEEE